MLVGGGKGLTSGSQQWCILHRWGVTGNLKDRGELGPQLYRLAAHAAGILILYEKYISFHYVSYYSKCIFSIDLCKGRMTFLHMTKMV